jgi:UV DNA damage endonuclease
MAIKLGYCCISLGEHKSTFKTITLTRGSELGLGSEELRTKLHGIWEHNLKEHNRVLIYNMLNSFRLFRISSALFPLADHINFRYLWTEFIGDKYAELWYDARSITRLYLQNDRLCMHPDQFVSLGSPNEQVRANSINNLEFHNDFLTLLGIVPGKWCPMNIHLSNGKDNIKNLHYWQDSFSKLSMGVMSRLVFENEDKGFWTWQKILRYFPEFPITLDFHHRNINNEGETVEEAIKECSKTWGDVTPLMHISEGKERPLDRTHHDYVQELPSELLELAKQGMNFDLEIEAKQKDLAVYLLWSKYHQTI